MGTPTDWVRVLSKPPPHKDKSAQERPAHLGPVTGPPKHEAVNPADKKGPLAGTASAWRAAKGAYGGLPGADALDHVLLNALRNYALLWCLIDDAPPRLLEALVRQFEPLW